MKMWLLILFVLSLSGCIKSKNLPCYVVEKEGELVCLCNATHCDTIEPPTKLGRRQFHVYSTSKNLPGFNHRTGNFRMQASPQGIKIEIKDDKKRQTVLGFGGAFSDSFGYVVDKLSNGSQTNLLRSYFSSEGIEYSLCRVVFGSSDFSLRHYSYVPKYDPSLKSFKLVEDDYTYKISVIQKANAMTNRKINLMGCSWSSPPWMKRNGKFGTDYLKRKFYQTYADYLVKTFDAFKENEIEFWGLSLGNEPITLIGFKNVTIENMLMLPEQQRQWIGENLGPSLVKAGYVNKSIIVLDDMRCYAEWWMDTVMRDDSASKYVDGVGLHWYLDFLTSPKVLDNIHEKYPTKEIIYTESSVNPILTIVLDALNGTFHNGTSNFQSVQPLVKSWERATIYISSIIENLNHWVTGYMDWNMALDLTGGPNLINLTCDAPVVVNSDEDEFYKQPMFYALGHFSKFLQPGAVILDSDLTSTYEHTATEKPPPYMPVFLVYKEVKYVVALNPDGTHAVIIYNPHAFSSEISILDRNRGNAFLILEPESLTTVIY